MRYWVQSRELKNKLKTSIGKREYTLNYAKSLLRGKCGISSGIIAETEF